jgi:hypothetical protein
MVPPLVKLTIGDIWKDQPGYIKGITNTIDDDTSWEISDGRMAPHGVTMNISYAIIEKNQISTGDLLYSFGNPVK